MGTAKLSISFTKDDVERLQKAKDKLVVQLEIKEDANSEPKFQTVVTSDIKPVIDLGWTYKINADCGSSSTSSDIKYGQHFKWNGYTNRESDDPDAEVKDDSGAPKNGFLLVADNDGIEISLILIFDNLKQGWSNIIYLGEYKKGKHSLIPKIPFKLVIIDSAGEEQSSVKFDYNNTSSQTVSYNSQKSWATG